MTTTKEEMPQKNRVDHLHMVITERHGCDSLHTNSHPLALLLDDQSDWNGVVDVFELIGHPLTQRCYAWTQPRGKKGRRADVVTVLEIPPVISPETAVKTFIATHPLAKKPTQHCHR